MKIHHHSCQCGWVDSDWCREPGCAYPEQSNVCPECYIPEDCMTFKDMFAHRALLAMEIHRGCIGKQSEYDALQSKITSRSKTNLHSSHIERMSR